MNIEDINLGDPPTGAGGDTMRTAFGKTNQNFGAAKQALEDEVQTREQLLATQRDQLIALIESVNGPLPALRADFKVPAFGSKNPAGLFLPCDYSDLFMLSAPSPKWVWNAQGQLVEIPAGQPAFGYDRFTGEPLGQSIEALDATNVLLNSFAPATQTVSVSDATTYTLSVYGSGSAEITAGGSGTATDGSPLTFTTTGTSVTVTVTGTLDVFQLEAGSVATSPIETAGSAVTRAADVASLDGLQSAEWFEDTMTWVVEFMPRSINAVADGPTNRSRILDAVIRTVGGAGNAAYGSYDGDNVLYTDVDPVIGETYRIAMTYSPVANEMKMCINGGSVNKSPYNGVFSSLADIPLVSGVDDCADVAFLSAKRGYATDAEMQELTE